jgi:hypothetical protein
MRILLASITDLAGHFHLAAESNPAVIPAASRQYHT